MKHQKEFNREEALDIKLSLLEKDKESNVKSTKGNTRRRTR